MHERELTIVDLVNRGIRNTQKQTGRRPDYVQLTREQWNAFKSEVKRRYQLKECPAKGLKSMKFNGVVIMVFRATTGESNVSTTIFN